MSAECGTTVIGPLSLVICNGKGTGRIRDMGPGRRDKGPAKGGQAEGTAKMAVGGRRPGTGIRGPETRKRRVLCPASACETPRDG